jgi:hypothetical protein
MRGIFRQIDTEAVLVAVISSVSMGRGEPRVFRVSDDTFDLILHIVESTRPGEPIRVEWFRLIGVSEPGLRILLSIHELFRRRSHENDIKELVRTLKPLDRELLSLFFHFLCCHSDQRLIPLDAYTARQQELSARHRVSAPVTMERLPAHLTMAVCCSIAGCNESKNYIVQRTGNCLFSGFMRLPYDNDNHRLMCSSKKTILLQSRNEDRRRAGNEGVPLFIERLRRGDISSFYGSYEPLSKLVRLPPGTSESDALIDDENENPFEASADAPTGAAKKAKRRDGSRRDSLVHSFVPEIAEHLATYQAALHKFDIAPTLHALYSLDYVPKIDMDRLSIKQIEEIEASRTELDIECKKEERRIFRLKTVRPCFEMSVTEAPIMGFVFEKDSSRSKNASFAATVCPSCACVFDFSTKLCYANGYEASFTLSSASSTYSLPPACTSLRIARRNSPISCSCIVHNTERHCLSRSPCHCPRGRYRSARRSRTS